MLFSVKKGGVICEGLGMIETHHVTTRQAVVVGKYVLGEMIGKGACGHVYKGLNHETGQFVAIKQIPLCDVTEDILETTVAEIELMKGLDHPAIVQYLESLKDDQFLYIIMEFIENGSLAGIIKKFGKLHESLVKRYIRQVLMGLAYLHAQGVVHRDIKGANILITKDGFAKLSDFGVARKLNQESKELSVVGTPYWMAPEVIEMAAASQASDIWSVGCTVIELLFGRPPYFDLPPMSALFRIVQDEHPPIPSECSSELKGFLMQCFRRDVGLRSHAQTLLSHDWLNDSNEDSTHLPSTLSTETLEAFTDLEETDMQPPETPTKISSAANALLLGINDFQTSCDPQDVMLLLQRKTSSHSLDGHMKSLNTTMTTIQPKYSPLLHADEGSEIDFEDDLLTNERMLTTLKQKSPLQDEEEDPFAMIDDEAPMISATRHDRPLLRESTLYFQQRHALLSALKAFYETCESLQTPSLPENIQNTFARVTDTLAKQFQQSMPLTEALFVVHHAGIASLLEILRYQHLRLVHIEALSQFTPATLQEIHDREFILCGTLSLLRILVDHGLAGRVEAMGGTAVLYALAMRSNFLLTQRAMDSMPITLHAPCWIGTIRIQYAVQILAAGQPSLAWQIPTLTLLYRQLESCVNHTWTLDTQSLQCMMNTLGSVLNAMASTWAASDSDTLHQINQGELTYLWLQQDSLMVFIHMLRFQWHRVTEKTDVVEIWCRQWWLPLSYLIWQQIRVIFELNRSEAVGWTHHLFKFISPSFLNEMQQFLAELLGGKLQHMDEISLHILKSIKLLSMELSLLNTLPFDDVIPILVHCIDHYHKDGDVPTSSSQRDVYYSPDHLYQCLNTLYNLCKLNKSRQEIAVEAGVVPHLQTLIILDLPLKQFALPVLCDFGYGKSIARTTLWRYNGIQFFLTLLMQEYWQVKALESLAKWTEDEPEKVSEILGQRDSLSALIGLFDPNPDNSYFVSLLEPFLRLLHASEKVRHALSMTPILPKLFLHLEHPDAIVRVNILKIMAVILDACDTRRSQYLAFHIIPLLHVSLQHESAVLVSKMGDQLIEGLESA